MECKVKDNLVGFLRPLDLIDTLWNVKSNLIADLQNIPVDLIDTLWNVK